MYPNYSKIQTEPVLSAEGLFERFLEKIWTSFLKEFKGRRYFWTHTREHRSYHIQRLENTVKDICPSCGHVASKVFILDITSALPFRANINDCCQSEVC